MRLLTTAILALLVTTQSASADGFICESVKGHVRLKAYHYTNPSEGTRRPAVLVASNPSMSAGNRFIARFTQASGMLNSRAATYEAKVDLRYNDVTDGLDTIGNSRLSELRALKLEVDFSYGRPILDGEYVPGTLFLMRRDGDLESIELDCERYLKN